MWSLTSTYVWAFWSSVMWSLTSTYVLAFWSRIMSFLTTTYVWAFWSSVMSFLTSTYVWAFLSSVMSFLTSAYVWASWFSVLSFLTCSYVLSFWSSATAGPFGLVSCFLWRQPTSGLFGLGIISFWPSSCSRADSGVQFLFLPEERPHVRVFLTSTHAFVFSSGWHFIVNVFLHQKRLIFSRWSISLLSRCHFILNIHLRPSSFGLWCNVTTGGGAWSLDWPVASAYVWNICSGVMSFLTTTYIWAVWEWVSLHSFLKDMAELSEYLCQFVPVVYLYTFELLEAWFSFRCRPDLRTSEPISLEAISFFKKESVPSTDSFIFIYVWELMSVISFTPQHQTSERFLAYLFSYVRDVLWASFHVNDQDSTGLSTGSCHLPAVTVGVLCFLVLSRWSFFLLREGHENHRPVGIVWRSRFSPMDNRRCRLTETVAKKFVKGVNQRLYRYVMLKCLSKATCHTKWF